MLNIEAN